MTLPLGIRSNNNPGNIRYDPHTDWVGQVGEGEGGFARFESIEYGIRAAAKILLTYMHKYGLRTVTEIIGRWAPPSENDTESYIATVCKLTHFLPDQLLADDEPTLVDLLSAIFFVELGGDYIARIRLELGVSLALV